MRMLHGEGGSIQGRLPKSMWGSFSESGLRSDLLEDVVDGYGVQNCLLHCCRDGGTDPSCCHINRVLPTRVGRVKEETENCSRRGS